MQEWDAAFQAYRAAQARINNSAAYLTLEWWRTRVGPLSPQVPTSLYVDMARALMASRRLARRLSQAYYQYARAMDSGYQLGDLEDGEDDGTLNSLRQNFLDRMNEAAMLGGGEEVEGHEAVRWFNDQLRDNEYDSSKDSGKRREALRRERLDREIQRFLDSWGEDRRVTKERYEWQRDSRPEDLRDWLEREVRERVKDESRDRRKKLRLRERESEQDTTEEEVEEEHEKAGQAVAGTMHEGTSDAARKVTEWAHNRDRRVKAVARGTSATPCSFCAMLASRGFAYNSVQSAMTTQNSAARPDAHTWSAGFRKVHPNCNCYPIIRWIDVVDGDLPDLNKEFQALWKKSNGTLKDFRRLMYKRNKQYQQTNSQEE